ncbi:PTS mannose/fructose/sorbose/N-acetylgalactosamine transporter subunit IIC [Sporolactobacillus vineae]|uniref:PTS mannose/fructose/sorbose/N-acetylgalactosamine transporter subunit IIC n=1 Tax=Sporolactobacillus vineae TaxID=444463 RepID=UPI0002882227|nr:PTS sugar transporter subunit IIC [Sporolactobacillus vineae]
MTLSIGLIIILTLYVGLAQIDALSAQLGLYSPLFGGMITGLLMGNITIGLLVGGTLQLMILGVATYGGASVPDYLSGSIIGTAYAILSAKGAQYGIGLAVPIGLLLTQLDVLARMSNLFFQHMADRHARTGDYRGVERANLFGIIPWTLSRMIPVFIGLFFGNSVVNLINQYMPAWLMLGLKTAGAILPALGIAILMRYLPLKKFFAFFIIGFVLMAVGGTNMTMMAVALIGLALAAIYMLFKNEFKPAPAGGSPAARTKQNDDDEEVEIDD